MQKLKDVPLTRLIPGGYLPCSHIWFTTQPAERNVHIDTNTVPPGFVFCANTVNGGDLVVTERNGALRLFSTTEGRVIGGSWPQRPHCNEKVNSGEVRCSFVIYLDHRVLSTSYVFLDDALHRQFTKEVQEHMEGVLNKKNQKELHHPVKQFGLI